MRSWPQWSSLSVLRRRSGRPLGIPPARAPPGATAPASVQFVDASQPCLVSSSFRARTWSLVDRGSALPVVMRARCASHPARPPRGRPAAGCRNVLWAGSGSGPRVATCSSGKGAGREKTPESRDAGMGWVLVKGARVEPTGERHVVRIRTDEWRLAGQARPGGRASQRRGPEPSGRRRRRAR